MKRLTLVIFCTVCSIVNAQNKFNPALKKTLDSALVLDQKYRGVLSLLMMPDKADSTAKTLGLTVQAATGRYWKLQNDIDSTNTILVEGIFSKYGYPGKTMVGDSTSEAAWYIIQHSKKIDDYLPMMKKAAESKELAFKLYAMMLDRQLMYHQQEQIYGTQATMRFIKSSGKTEWVVWPIKDPENVNKRRQEAGFPNTVEDNAKRMDITYRVVKLDDVKIN